MWIPLSVIAVALAVMAALQVERRYQQAVEAQRLDVWAREVEADNARSRAEGERYRECMRPYREAYDAVKLSQPWEERKRVYEAHKAALARCREQAKLTPTSSAPPPARR